MQGMSKAAMKGYLERLEEKEAEAAAAKKKERYIEIALGADPTAGCPMQFDPYCNMRGTASARVQ